MARAEPAASIDDVDALAVRARAHAVRARSSLVVAPRSKIASAPMRSRQVEPLGGRADREDGRRRRQSAPARSR